MLGIKPVSMKWVGFVLRLKSGDTPAKFCSYSVQGRNPWDSMV